MVKVAQLQNLYAFLWRFEVRDKHPSKTRGTIYEDSLQVLSPRQQSSTLDD